MKFLIFADPLSGLKADFDSGLAMLREGLKRGHEMYWCLADDFYLRGTELYVFPTLVKACEEDQLPKKEDLITRARDFDNALRVRDFDGVWIRKDPQFDHVYLSLCWLLSLEENDTRILNPPRTLAQYHEKMLPLIAYRRGFIGKDDIAPFYLSTGSDFEFPPELTGHELITKPWYGWGGRGVRKWKSIQEASAFGDSLKKEYVMFQEFLPRVSTEGDRRVLFFNGEVQAHFMRVPTPGMIATNIAQGAKPKLAPLSEKEDRIAKAIGPFLRELGILLAGVDFMSDRLSEINITAPSGLQLGKRLCGVDIAAKWVDYAETNKKRVP